MTDGIRFDSIESAIQDLKQGKLIILLDSKGRENEGDLIGVAAKVTPQIINFMVTHARGAFIAVFMTEEQCEELKLPFMVDPKKNNESNKTPFKITCDTSHGGSGSSAVDRAQTVNILGGVLKKYKSIFDEGEIIKEKSDHSDLLRPGHVQPISTSPKGLYERQGHTDAGLELVKLAGFSPPSAVDLEIMDPTGNMAREEYLYTFAKQYNLKIIHIHQLLEYLNIPRVE